MTKPAVVAIVIMTFLTCTVFPATAVDVAPRISDREIIEGLSELKQGNRNINKRIDNVSNRIADVNKRIDDVNNRIDDLKESVNHRIDDLKQSMDQRFESMDQRFESMDQRFGGIDQRFISIEQRIDGLQNSLQNLIVTLFGSVMALIVMLIGYMVWDRKTAQQPMRARLTALEKQISQQLDPNDTANSIVARLLAVQRRMARNNAELAEAMHAEALM